MQMIRIYIKDNQIVKTVNEGYFDVESPVEGATHQDLDFDINDQIVYEGGQVILFKDSEAFQTRKSELEAIEQRTEQEQKELDYLLSL